MQKNEGSSGPIKEEKLKRGIDECRRMEITILPPDINQSFEGFTVIKNKIDSIRFGLTTIKNFGAGIAASIIQERKNSGQFTSLSDFLRRITDKNLNKKSLESLIKTGAFDSFSPNDPNYRAILLHNLDRLLEFNREEKGKKSDQVSLFSLMREPEALSEIHLDMPDKTNPTDRLLWEKELLGLYISGHPLENFKHKFENKENDIKKIKETAKEKKDVVAGGIIEELKILITKNGDKMAIFKLIDLSDSIEAVAFPKTFEEFQDMLIAENCIVVKGTIAERNGAKNILVDKVKLME